MKWLHGASLLVGMLGAARAGALPVLSEVCYDAVGSDDGLVFVEIHGEPGASLDGLTVAGINGSGGGVTVSFALSGVIPADGLHVVADDGGGGVTSVPGADQVLDFDFQNGPDSILLLDGDTVLDALGYGVFGPGEVFAGEGSPSPDAPAGSSLARRFADIDTDDNASDFVVIEVPTPGSAPLAGVPEPSSGLLLALGLLGLLRRSGRGPARIRRLAFSGGDRFPLRAAFAAAGPGAHRRIGASHRRTEADSPRDRGSSKEVQAISAGSAVRR